jgi:putative ABC transport system ATP-binding protein
VAVSGLRTPAIEARNLYRFYRAGEEETLALQGVSLSVQPGEFVAVTGPSGSGKTTLLGCLAGTDDPTGGTVFVGGRRLSHQPESTRCAVRARHIGLMFQSANLFDHLTVTQNLRLVAALASRQRAPGRLSELLGTLGLAGRAHAYPATLSGGERTRAALAVALANDPIVLLADEPTGELDTATEVTVLALLGAAAARGTAIVAASHSRAVAASASRTLVLADGRLA